MAKVNIEKEIGYAELKLSSIDKKICYIEKGINKFKDYMNKLIRSGTVDNDKLSEFLHKEYNNILYEYLQIAGTGIAEKQLQALKTVNSNQYILDRIYEEIKDENFENVNFEERTRKLSGTEEEFEKTEVSVALDWIRKESKFISPKILEIYNKIISEKDSAKRRKYKEALVKTFKHKDILEYIEIFAANSEKEKLSIGLKLREKEIEKEMFKNQKEHFKIAGRFLQKYGLLKNYVKTQNRDYEKLEMPEMNYSLNTDKTENSVGVVGIFEDEYIDSLTTEQLAVLNAFWQNRFIKEIIDLGKILFIFDTLNLWDNYNKEILTKDQIKVALLKEKICDGIYERIKESISQNVQEKTFSYGVIDLSIISEEEKQKYQEYFNQMLPEIKHDLSKDIMCSQNKRNFVNVIYKAKYNILQGLLLDIEHNPDITNWGYMKDGKVGETITERKNILIAIDYPGFNMPLRLHMDREKVIEFMKIRKNSTVIPIYEGTQDFIYKGQLLTTILFMPLTEKRESAIIGMNKKINATDSRYGYIKHLSNLITKKVKGIKKIYPSRYIDLETGLEGIKTRDNNFIPEEGIDENGKLR